MKLPSIDSLSLTQRFLPLVVCSFFIISMVAGCQNNASQSGDQQAVVAVLEKNAQATQNENVDEYLSTLHPDSAMYNSSKAMLPGVFAAADMKCRVEESKIESIDANEAVVHYTLLTESVVHNDSAFRNNRTRQIVTMRKHNNAWKMYSGKVEKIEYVN
jgi:ketosteroid isomerase-like protein